MKLLNTELKRQNYYSSVSEATKEVYSGLQGENLYHTSTEISGRTNLTQFLKAKFRSCT